MVYERRSKFCNQTVRMARVEFSKNRFILESTIEGVDTTKYRRQLPGLEETLVDRL